MNSAQISVVPSSTGDVQLVVKDLSTAGEPLKKKRKVVNVLPDSLENQQENLVVLKEKENVRCYGRVRKPLVQVNKCDNVVPHK